MEWHFSQSIKIQYRRHCGFNPVKNVTQFKSYSSYCTKCTVRNVQNINLKTSNMKYFLEYIIMLHHCVFIYMYMLGGVLFIEQGLPNSSLPASDSASSSISSPTTTDSGLENSTKATSREDLSDLDQCSSSVTTPSSSTIPPGTDQGSPDAQVWPLNNQESDVCF